MSPLSTRAQILLVEDNPGDVLLTEEALAEAKVANDVHVAEDGEIAMRFLRQEEEHAGAPRPDLVLLDLNLPRMDGREVLAEVKSDPVLRRIPVIVLTTSEAEQDILRSYDLHANGYVTKPLDIGDFLAAVRRIEGFWLELVRLPTES
jgi:two-component system, chemotaxis family, response regulator Rcp1